MNSFSTKHFYLFKGDWYEKFIELIDLPQQFVILEPQDKTKGHNLLIVFGSFLPEAYCYNKNIWKSMEKVFESFYENKMEQFNIHGNFSSIAETEKSLATVSQNQFI